MFSSNIPNILDEVRNRDRSKEFKIAFKISAIRLIGPLFPLFSLSDYILFPDKFVEFFLLRLSVTVYCCAFYYFNRKKISLNSLIIRSLLLIFYPACVINFMIYLVNDLSSVYFVGLNLIASGAICFFPWRNPFDLAAVSLIVYGPYFLLPLVLNNSYEGIHKFFVNCAFIMGTLIISYVIRFIYEKLKLSEIDLRMKLKNEILNRDRIIESKTNEAIKLKNLSKQFSPQIVKSIHDGDLNLNSSLKEDSICAVFIDIVDSTKKMVTLESKSLQKVLASYVEDVMGIMLKYDITVDKFLGDGVLGFSNNPIRQDDYIERVIRCSFEILNRLKFKKDFYEQYWDGDFSVRIGISVGSAAVGFYGSDLHVKSYTAIGKVMNLAARINGVAPKNGIVFTSDVVTFLKEKKSGILNSIELVKLKEINLKGFENESIGLYEVINLDILTSLDNDIDMACPNGHGVLYLDKNLKGIYELRCRECDFKKIDSIAQKNKTA